MVTVFMLYLCRSNQLSKVIISCLDSYRQMLGFVKDLEAIKRKNPPSGRFFN
jgi:hypothetical protein